MYFEYIIVDYYRLLAGRCVFSSNHLIVYFAVKTVSHVAVSNQYYFLYIFMCHLYIYIHIMYPKVIYETF